MIDLCKLFEVEDGEEFRLKGENKAKCRFRIYDNEFQYYSDNSGQWLYSIISLNSAAEFEIIKLPKKKEFTDDELAIMRSLPIEIKWIARDSTKEIFGYEDKPFKHDGIWCRQNNGGYRILSAFSHIFKEITTEDEEPVFIDDYVERGAE